MTLQLLMLKVLGRVYGYYSNNERQFSGRPSTTRTGKPGERDHGFLGGIMTAPLKLDFKFSRRKITAEVTVR